MDNHKSLVNWIFSSMVAIISFFLFMFFKKVDATDEKLQQIITINAVREVQLDGLNNRITNLERAVNELTQQNQISKIKP